jgi:beta-glucosidase
VRVKNTSGISGKEVVQLYISDDYASLIPNGKTLKRFAKLNIAANGVESKTFYVSKKDLMFVGSNGEFIVENGTFTISVGNLKKTFTYSTK